MPTHRRRWLPFDKQQKHPKVFGKVVKHSWSCQRFSGFLEISATRDWEQQLFLGNSSGGNKNLVRQTIESNLLMAFEPQIFSLKSWEELSAALIFSVVLKGQIVALEAPSDSFTSKSFHKKAAKRSDFPSSRNILSSTPTPVHVWLIFYDKI